MAAARRLGQRDQALSALEQALRRAPPGPLRGQVEAELERVRTWPR